MKFFVDPTVKPHAVHTPAPIPIHFREEVKAQLDMDEKLGVIGKVPPNTPVTWCARMVIATKADGSPRRTVDLQALNAASPRQTHHTQSPYHAVREIPAFTKKTTFDAWNGYHSVEIHKEDKHYTTFLTEFGRYHYNRIPQGYTASGDGYTIRYYKVVEEFKNKCIIIDDACQYSWTDRDAFFECCRYLETCGNNGVVLNPKKFVYAQDVVDFAGYEIGPDYVKPSKKFFTAINDLSRPETITDVRAFFGLVEQVAYTCYCSDIMAPFRELLKPGNADKGKIRWDAELDKAFAEAKVAMIEAMEEGVRIYDMNLPTAVSSDWCKMGIGQLLSQKHCKCVSEEPGCCPTGWKVVAFASRFCHPAEKNYSPVEGEALSAAVGLKKFKHFIMGCKNLSLVVDHKPLLKLFGDKRMEDIENMRLLRLKEKTLPYTFKVIHRPGLLHKGPDFASRYPQDAPEHFLEGEEEVINMIEDIEVGIHGDVVSAWEESGLQKVTWQMIKQATENDEVLSKVRDAIENGHMGDVRSADPEIKPFLRYSDRLYVQDGVVLMGNRIAVPDRLQNRVLECLHSAHQGVTQMYARAELAVFWPNLHSDLEQIRADCATCRMNAPSNPKLPPHEPPQLDYPFQQICLDYMKLNGVPYLVTVDRLTGWPDVRRSRYDDAGAKGLITMLREIFTTYGIAEEVTSDGCSEIMSHEVQKFLKSYGVSHRVSSVGNPHANQRAEVGVKSMKRLLRGNVGPNGTLNNDEFARAILQYRNTPLQSTGLSPALALFGRPLRDFIPISSKTYMPSPQWSRKLSEREEKMRQSQEREKAKWSEHAKKQLPLKVGHIVSIQNLEGNHPLKWDRTGIVVEVKQHDQYNVRVDGSGRITLRNRKNLRVIGFRQPRDPFDVVPVQGGGNKEKPQEKEKESIIGGRPMGKKTPVRSPEVQTPRRDSPSPLFHTPPEVTPRRSVSSPVSQPVPVRVPGPVSGTPRRPTNAVSKRLELQDRCPVTMRPVSSPAKPIYHQLRDFNKPGLLDKPIDVYAPRMTRSGRSYTSYK